MSAVMRSGSGRTTWNNYGAYLARVSGRSCNYLFENGNTNFHYNQYPSRVWKDGTELSAGYSLSPLNQWKVVTIEVASGCGTSNYFIGRSDHSQADIEIAEILAFGDVLSDSARGGVEAYLGQKWNITVT